MRTFLALLLAALGFAAQAAQVVWNLQDSATVPQGARSLSLYPLAAPGTNGAGVIVTRDWVTRPTATNGTLTVSNLYGGDLGWYRSEFAGTKATTTNYYHFPVTNGVINAADWVSPTTNGQAGIVAYSQAQADAKFYPLLTNPSNYLKSGTLTNAAIYADTATNVLTIGGADDPNANGSYYLNSSLILGVDPWWTNSHSYSVVLDSGNYYLSITVAGFTNNGDYLYNSDTADLSGSWSVNEGVTAPTVHYFGAGPNALTVFGRTVLNGVLTVTGTLLADMSAGTNFGGVPGPFAGGVNRTVGATNGVFGTEVQSFSFAFPAAMTTNAGPTAEFVADAAPFPECGYNTYYDALDQFGGDYASSARCLDETNLLAIARLWKTNGMFAAGFTWIHPDDGWTASSRDARGNLVYNSALYRTGAGLPTLNSNLHFLGYRVGGYLSMNNGTTCFGRPGTTVVTIQRDLDYMASVGFDGVKIDACGQSVVASVFTPLQAALIHSAANAASLLGKKMVVNMTTFSGNPFWDPSVPLYFEAPTMLNEYITGYSDQIQYFWNQVSSRYQDSMSNTVFGARWAITNYVTPNMGAYIKKGHYPFWAALETDSRVVGNFFSQSSWSTNMYRGQCETFVAMSAMTCQPIHIGSVDPGIVGAFTNQETMAIMLDPGQIPATRSFSNSFSEIYVKPLGRPDGTTNALAFAVDFVNWSNNINVLTVTTAMLGIGSGVSFFVRDASHQVDVGTFTGGFTKNVEGLTNYLYRITAQSSFNAGSLTNYANGTPTWSAETVNGAITAQGFQTQTNLFVGTLFLLGTNYSLACSSNLTFTGVGNLAAGAATGYGELTIKATGTVVVTNPAAWFANDGLTNRTLTNGNLGEMSMKVVPGFSTNFVFTQHWHP